MKKWDPWDDESVHPLDWYYRWRDNELAKAIAAMMRKIDIDANDQEGPK